MEELQHLIAQARKSGKEITEVQAPFQAYQLAYEPSKTTFTEPTQKIIGLLYGYKWRDTREIAVILK